METGIEAKLLRAGVISWKHGQNERLHKRAEEVAENDEDRICGRGRRIVEGVEGNWASNIEKWKKNPTSCTIDIIRQMAVVAKTADTAGSARKRSMLINLDTFVMFPVCFLTTSATQCRRYFGISEYELIMPNA